MGHRLVRAAERDVLGSYLEAARTFGVAQAEAYRTALERTFAPPAEHPRLAPLRSATTPPVRLRPTGVHLGVDTVDAADEVLVMHLRHGREDRAQDPV